MICTKSSTPLAGNSGLIHSLMDHIQWDFTYHNLLYHKLKLNEMILSGSLYSVH